MVFCKEGVEWRWLNISIAEREKKQSDSDHSLPKKMKGTCLQSSQEVAGSSVGGDAGAVVTAVVVASTVGFGGVLAVANASLGRGSEDKGNGNSGGPK